MDTSTPRTSTRTFPWTLWPLLLAALLAACGGNDPAAEPPSEVTQSVGPAGGTLDGPDGVQVVIPAGALDAPTTIGIARSNTGAPAALPEDHAAASAIYEFTPHGLVFAKPVTVRMPIPSGAATDAFYWAEPGEDWQLHAATATNGVAEWQRNDFSFGFIPYFCAPSNRDPYSASNPDPYPCMNPRGGATVSATPSSAATQLAVGNWNGSAGSWRVTEPATLRLTLNYKAAPDCGNPHVKLVRRNPAAASSAQVLFDGAVAPLTPQVIAPPPGSALSGGGAPALQGVGSHSVDVAFTTADNTINPAGLHAFTYTFSCNRPQRATVSGSDTITIVSAVVAPPVPPAQYSVGGTVSGLAGSGLVLQNNGGDDLPVSANGSFSFATTLASGSAYAVTVRSQPVGQTCTVAQGSGTLNANVGSVLVDCTATPAAPVWSAPVAVSPAGVNAAEPALGAGADGSATLAWVQYDAAPQSQYNAYASRWLAGSWSVAELIETLDANLAASLSGGAYTPVVAQVSAGRTAVAFGYSVSPGRYDTGVARFDGSGWTSELVAPGGNSNSATVAATGDGSAAMLLYAQYDGISRYVMRAKRLDFAGGVLTEGTPDTASGSTSSGAVAALGSGDALAAWMGAGGLWVNHYGAGAQAWDTALSLPAASSNGAYPPSLAGNVQGTGIVAWLNLDSGYQVNVARYAGGSWSTTTRLAPQAGQEQAGLDDSDRPGTAVGVDATGDAFVAWKQGATGNGRVTNVWVRRCPAAQSLANCDAAVMLDTRSERVSVPRLVVASNGDVWAAWVSNDASGAYEVRAARRGPAGWGAAVTVGAARSSLQAPALAVDGLGHAVLAWLGDDSRIHVARAE